MPDQDPSTLSATQAAAAIRAGTLTAETLARACLARAESRDPTVKAWSYLDPALVIHQAREIDKRPPISPLHGIPIGVKDMIDTVDMPTQHNSAIYANHRPNQDAAAVARLRAAGAVIMGKTDTTEFAAAGRPAATRNPFDPARTPGGSSSGSAAAVADHQVPLALGTQTGGSTIRPASFCGIYALKPSWGAVSREGLKLYSLTLDTLSWFARDLEDLGLMADIFDIHDDATPRPVAVKGLKIAYCRTPVWQEAEPGTIDAMEDAAERLRQAGAHVTDLILPDLFHQVVEAQPTIMWSEGRAAFHNLLHTHPHLLHDDFVARATNRNRITRAQLLAAYDIAAQGRVQFDAIARGYDAVLTPSCKGEAPVGTSPGVAIFNQMWTLLHVPCVNIPSKRGPNGMPVGVTLTSPRFTDRQLLQIAAAVAPVVNVH